MNSLIVISAGLVGLAVLAWRGRRLLASPPSGPAEVAVAFEQSMRQVSPEMDAILSMVDLDRRDRHLIVHFKGEYAYLSAQEHAVVENAVARLWRGTTWVLEWGWSPDVEYIEHPPLAGPHDGTGKEQWFPMSTLCEIDARITEGSGIGPYAFRQILRGPGGWTDGELSDAGGTDPAYNRLEQTPVLPVNVRLVRDGGSWRFTAEGVADSWEFTAGQQVDGDDLERVMAIADPLARLAGLRRLALTSPRGSC